MFTQVNGLKVCYQVAGSGPPLLFLHGWGGRGLSFAPVFHYFARSYRVCAPDLPGFGESDIPPTGWGVADYTSFVCQFMEEMGFRQVDLMAHSFGGRIALMMAAQQPERVRRIVLVDSAGIRPRQGWKYRIRVGLFKAVKRFASLPFLRQHQENLLAWTAQRMGSSDYRNAGPLRETFVKVVNEDLRPLLPQITVPTLLVWGENDQDTPVYQGRIMEQEIPTARLVVLENAGHFAYLDRLSHFCTLASDFLREG
jgi:pimeloyl-ACP methyl ester carboxylesterase